LLSSPLLDHFGLLGGLAIMLFGEQQFEVRF
jgi:hypothetical protein